MIWPIKMTWDEFIGPYGKGSAPLLAAARVQNLIIDPRSTLHKIKRDDELEYTISNALRSPHPERHNRIAQKSGAMVCVHLLNNIVGALGTGFVWVHPEHQKYNLAAEMGIAWFVMTWEDGTNWRCTEEGRANHKPDQYPPAGIAYRKKQYRMMVERGLLDPGDSTMP